MDMWTRKVDSKNHRGLTHGLGLCVLVGMLGRHPARSGQQRGSGHGERASHVDGRIGGRQFPGHRHVRGVDVSNQRLGGT